MTAPMGPTPYDWLAWHASSRPDARALAEWSDGGTGWDVTFGHLRDLVDSVAAALDAINARAGDRLVLSLPNGIEFVATLLACCRAGVIAVPAPIPNIGRSEAYRERMTGIVLDSRPRFAVTTERSAPGLAEILAAVAVPCRTVTWNEIITVAAAPAAGGRGDCPVALLQYTSGSTTRPRGVMITNDMLSATCAQATRIYRENSDDVAVTWVPLYHDMGLITGLMRPLFSGYSSVLLTPQQFLAAPATWMDAVHICRGTVASAPNSGYELCVRKIDTPEHRGWDLSSWRVARNAGEVVRAQTVDRFVRHLAPAGFDPAAMAPSYGLAEATLVVTSCGPDEPPKRLWVPRSELGAEDSTRPLTVHAADRSLVDNAVPGAQWVELVSSGPAAPGTEIRVTAGVGQPAIGRIAVRGPQVTPGYWAGALPEPGVAADWLATGDIGFVHDEHLFVLGRMDDTFTLRGRNYFMIDVVAACGTVPGIRPGRSAAFLLDDEPTATETVCVVAEVARDCARTEPVLAALSHGISKTLARTLELGTGVVGLLRPGDLPVTTSGKVRVAETRRRYLAREFSFLNLVGGDNGAIRSARDDR